MNPFIEYKALLEKYLHEETIPFLREAWKEPWRKYHGMNHLEEILNNLKESQTKVHPIYFDALVLAAFFHDCYYNPRDNKVDENESMKRFIASFKHDEWRIRNAVMEMIETTKHRKRPAPGLLRTFWEADNAGFSRGYDTILKHELLIREEYVHVPKSIYKKKRVEFLKSNIGLFDSEADKNINKLIEYVNDTY